MKQLNKKKIDRNLFIKLMHQKKIGTGVHYISIPEHPFYKNKYGWKLNDYPVAKKIGRETVSIPFSPYLNKKEIDYIVKEIISILT